MNTVFSGLADDISAQLPLVIGAIVGILAVTLGINYGVKWVKKLAK